MDYTTLSPPEIASGLEVLARDAETTFGSLDVRQLNWRPDAARWSVAQCLDHVLTANQLMLQSADNALKGAPRTIWQRMPVLPRAWGRLLIRSQAPTGTRTFTAPATARPASSDISADVLQRFVQQQRDAAACVAALDERRAARTIMTSPFVRFITYSVLDGWRVVYAHDCRHVEQARRVIQTAGFPGAPPA